MNKLTKLRTFYISMIVLLMGVIALEKTHIKQMESSGLTAYLKFESIIAKNNKRYLDLKIEVGRLKNFCQCKFFRLVYEGKDYERIDERERLLDSLTEEEWRILKKNKK